MTIIDIGRLLRAGNTGFTVGCRVTQLETLALGAMVQVDLGVDYRIYGLVYDIHIDDDGLVRQLVTAEEVDESVIADNRLNRNVPLEMSVLAIGYRQNGMISHLLPPRPPLSLDKIFLCAQEELCKFTSVGNFGYFRHILRAENLPVEELLAAHLRQAQRAHVNHGDPTWIERASQEIIILLRDNYPLLMNVLGSLRDVMEIK